MKKPLPRSEDLLRAVAEALTPKRHPLLIAIDGPDDCGKSSLAAWLSWQLNVPAINLDLFLIDLDPPQWRTADLESVVSARIDRQLPLVVDSVFVLDVIERLGRTADFWIFVRGEPVGSSVTPHFEKYCAQRLPLQNANFVIDGFGPTPVDD